MAYDESNVYAKYLTGSSSSSSSSGCSECNESTSECSDCCPPGLIAIQNPDGTHAGCVTPNDAEQYNLAKPCANGYVKVVVVSDSTVLGCVSETEFAAIYAAVNP